MADPVQIMQRLQSQRAIRQQGDRNVLLQRQRQQQEAQRQIQQQEAQRQIQQQEAQRQIQQQQGSNRVQTAVNEYFSSPKRQLGSSFAYLTKEEQQKTQNIISELESSFERSGKIGDISIANLIKNIQIKQVQAQELQPQVSQSQVSQVVYGPQLPEFKATLREISPQRFEGTSKIGTITNIQGRTTARQIPRIITDTNLVTGEKRYYQETFAEDRPLVVAPANVRSFGQQVRDIVTAPVPQTRSGAYNLPAQVRKISSVVELSANRLSSKIKKELINLGASSDAPLFKENIPTTVSIFGRPYSIEASKVLGETVLGGFFAPAFATATSGQVAVSGYVKNGIFYEIDSAGNVVSARNLAEFSQALRESAIFKKAGARYYNEPDLIAKTRELINKARPEQLKSLRELYKKEGRLDLFDDILAQEKNIITQTNIQSQITTQAIRDQPKQITGAGSITGQFTGTGQYERTEQVSSLAPRQTQSQITNPSLLSNSNVALGQSSFNQLSLSQRPVLFLSQGVANIQTSVQTSIPKTELSQRNIQFLVTPQSVLQSLSQRQQQRLVQILRNPTQARPTRPILKPLLKPLSIKLGIETTSKSNLIKKISNYNLGIEVKRFGKFKPIGTETTLEGALKKASRLVDVSLARSFRLRDLDTGKVIEVSKTPYGFRRSKREINTFVEESRFALSTGGEKREISYFKNKSKKRFKLL